MTNPIPEVQHRYKMQILEKHLDTFGHVNNATYLEILEEARWDWITSGGYGLKEIQEKQIGPVILEINIRFKKELRLREAITIQSYILNAEEKVGVIKQEILNEAGDICSVAQITMGLFDLKTRRLISPTEDWIQAVSKKN